MIAPDRPDARGGLAAPSRVHLRPGEAHVWLLRSDAPSSALLARYAALLAPDERARHDAYRFERTRREYLCTRALVRTTLSRYADVAPDAWRFVTTARGRPEIAAGLADEPLRFNVSNTRGLVACLVVSAIDVGVDVEDGAREGEPLDLADRVFAPAEAVAARDLPHGERRARFFTLWTLKEAYAKARGLGLSLPFDQLAFQVDARGIGAAFPPALGDDAAAWQFRVARLGAHHLAVALRRGARPDYALITHEVVPFASDAPLDLGWR